MITNEEMTQAQIAWLLFKKLGELNSLLWENYAVEFRKIIESEEIKEQINQENLPF